jgi:hypothetical protein
MTAAGIRLSADSECNGERATAAGQGNVRMVEFYKYLRKVLK